MTYTYVFRGDPERDGVKQPLRALRGQIARRSQGGCLRAHPAIGRFTGQEMAVSAGTSRLDYVEDDNTVNFTGPSGRCIFDYPATQELEVRGRMRT